MERLTTRCNGQALMAWEHEEKHTTQEWIDILTDRLAAYEDTGLTPEEITELKTTLFAVRHRVDDIEVLKNILRMEAKQNETD